MDKLQILRRHRANTAFAAALIALGGTSAVAAAGDSTSGGNLASGARATGQSEASVAPQGAAVAQCPSGKVVSGGFAAPGFTRDGAPAVRVGSGALSKRQWSIDAVAMGGRGDDLRNGPNGNPSGPSSPDDSGYGESPTGTIISYAYCGKHTGRIKTRESSVVIQPRTLGTATARCGRGQRAIAGGFASPGFDVTSSAGVLALTSHKAGKRGWTVQGMNVNGDDGLSPQPGTLTAIAYCLKHAPRLITRSQQATVTPEQLRTIDTSCPPDSKAISGGFDANVGPLGEDSTAAGVIESYRMRRAAGWTTSAISIDDGVGATMTAYVYCLKMPA